MPFNDLERKCVEKAVGAFLVAVRPLPDLRPQLGYDYVLNNQTIELREVRPAWDNPSEILKRPFAKATYVRTAAEWRVYWMRGNGKWHAYDPPSAPTVQSFLQLVQEDRMSCFFG
jgi:hypothetical protein